LAHVLGADGTTKLPIPSFDVSSPTGRTMRVGGDIMKLTKNLLFSLSILLTLGIRTPLFAQGETEPTATLRPLPTFIYGVTLDSIDGLPENPESSVDKKPAETEDSSVKDVHGNILQTGDSVVVIKDLKVKGSSLVVKGGTKVKNIRLVESSDGHNIACKIDGLGSMNLKSEFVKKSN
jgi:protein PhnA